LAALDIFAKTTRAGRSKSDLSAETIPYRNATVNGFPEERLNVVFCQLPVQPSYRDRRVSRARFWKYKRKLITLPMSSDKVVRGLGIGNDHACHFPNEAIAIFMAFLIGVPESDKVEGNHGWQEACPLRLSPGVLEICYAPVWL
jgi:hypothetical protein